MVRQCTSALLSDLSKFKIVVRVFTSRSEDGARGKPVFPVRIVAKGRPGLVKVVCVTLGCPQRCGPTKCLLFETVIIRVANTAGTQR